MKVPITERPLRQEPTTDKALAFKHLPDTPENRHIYPEGHLIRKALEGDAENRAMRRWLGLTSRPYKIWNVVDRIIHRRSRNHEDYFTAVRQSIMPPARSFRYMICSSQTTPGFEPDEAPWKIMVRCLLVKPPSSVGKAPELKSLLDWRNYPVASASTKVASPVYRPEAHCPTKKNAGGCYCRPYRTWGRRMVFSKQDPAKTHLTGEWLVTVYLFSNDRKFMENADLGEMAPRWPKNTSEGQKTNFEAAASMLRPDGSGWAFLLCCRWGDTVTTNRNRQYGTSNKAEIQRHKVLYNYLEGVIKMHGVNSRAPRKIIANR
ncbi:hypothetical protein B0T21DRAFT_412733 [Apiosordaria backusii]|uniref:Uncharacterized protein n=1 Tax=Apiosordaria backusii TaxID=314023 RepID=A0AA40E8U8_9PEZI|nr:hypothetical protein B0T21DRAFT_412733 [Apiosordaria backusii]